MFKSILVLITLFSVSVSQTSNNEALDLAKKFLKINGSSETAMVMIKQMIDQFRSMQSSGLPETFWKELEDEFKGDGMTNLVAPIYAKHFTVDELTDLIKFYQSPTGKKFAKKTPVITQESMVAGQEWGRELGQKIMKKIMAERNKN